MRYHPTDELEEVRSHKFVTMETKWAKHIWHECVEQHTFFRLAVPGTPPLPRVIPQLNRDAKYRFSGRTLQQMIQPRPEPSPKRPALVQSPAPPVQPGDYQNTTTHELKHTHTRTHAYTHTHTHAHTHTHTHTHAHTIHSVFHSISLCTSDHWVPPRTPSPVVGVNVGHYVRTVSVDVSTGTKPVNHSHAVSMISFPYDYSPSPRLQYRIVIRDGRKIFNKVLSDPPPTPPVPSYRLKWTYIRTSDLEESNKLESGVAVIQTQELVKHVQCKCVNGTVMV